MKLLAFDTSTEHLSIAVGREVDGCARVWTHDGPGGAMASATLIPSILGLLEQGWARGADLAQQFRREAVLDLHFAPTLERYLVELVLASRDARPYDQALARRIAWGASPRGSIALERCARARAWLDGRDFVTPEDLHAIAPDVLRHRVLPSYEATAEGWDGGRLVDELLRVVPLP